MSTGIKVLLIGCISVVVIGVIALGVGGYFVKTWFTEKKETFKNVLGTEDSEYGKKTAELNEKYPFTPPADNIVRENQLQRFLAVRKEMNVVYKQHEAEIKKMTDKPNPTASDALGGLSIINDIHMAQLTGLQAQNMSKDEYEYLRRMVYINWVAMTVNQALESPKRDEMVEQQKRSLAELDQQLQNPDLPAEQRQQLQTTRDEMQKQFDLMNTEMERIEKGLEIIPKENIELFKKYDQEIKENGMLGLDVLI
ncbi:hypothetical protein L0222_32740 [bacterium]|nr:hypothetical protein [bacterium]